MMAGNYVSLFLLGCQVLAVSAFSSQTRTPRFPLTALSASNSNNNEETLDGEGRNCHGSRREFVSALALGSTVLATQHGEMAYAADDDEEESIVARAARLSREIEAPVTQATIRTTDKTSYDFSLPVEGQQVPFMDLIHQEKVPSNEEGGQEFSKVKAFLVVNIKQDDPIARKNIPEMISLASKYGRSGEFVVISCPSDQGYFEPDTSALIRLKLASEYGYGINPSTVITDKVNYLGTGAHPYWRWLEGTCRTPAGLGRIQGNFEKFLVDGRTGLPVRRYPRKYMPLDIKNDIEALVEGRPLPPAGANWMEQWRAAVTEGERDTYRFEKGLNVFDQ